VFFAVSDGSVLLWAPIERAGEKAVKRRTAFFRLEWGGSPFVNAWENKKSSGITLRLNSYGGVSGFPQYGRSTVKDLWITCVCFGGISTGVLIFIRSNVFYSENEFIHLFNSL
jgi:hypothetical protein